MNIVRCTIQAYDPATHSADVELWGADTYLTVPVSHTLPYYMCQIGAIGAVLFLDETDDTDCCLLFTYSGRPPRDPHFDPATGHKHRGIQDDAPTL